MTTRHGRAVTRSLIPALATVMAVIAASAAHASGEPTRSSRTCLPIACAAEFIGVDADALRITVTTESSMTGLDPVRILWRHLDETEVQLLARAAIDAPPSASAVTGGVAEHHDRVVLAVLLACGDVPPVTPHG